MDNHQQHRGRSPSASREQQYLNSTPSSMPMDDNAIAAGLGLDPSLLNSSSAFSSHSQLYLDNADLPQHLDPANLSNPSLLHHNRSVSPHLTSQPNDFAQAYLDQGADAGQLNHDFSLLQDQQSSADQALEQFLLDPSLQNNQAPNGSINPADIMSDLSAPMQPSSPAQMVRRPSGPGHRSSSSMNQQQFQSYHGSRHTSLDPSSAAFPQGQIPTDWSGVLQSASFQGHRRAPSDTHSDVSSVAPSPFISTQESFDSIEHHHSPLLGAQQDTSLFNDGGLGIERFTISDQPQHISPGHSPIPSPRMSPQQVVSPRTGNNPYLYSQNDSGQFNGVGSQNIFMSNAEQFPSLQSMEDPNQLGQMAPPEINIEFAANSQPLDQLQKQELDDGNALSPPEGRKGRTRAKSDPYVGSHPISRPMTPRSPSPHLGTIDLSSAHRSLSPHDIIPGASSASQKSSRRSSTSSIPNRDYFLDLADPQRPGSGTESKRTQKHPATFQCTLCPKRFTRAYNLRSHLRTHTDERPFVCTVCGKAFARQHDRKRHESLHSGEKKFVCKGELKGGSAWGCGRRFARADALGRHFRSEAGRICIKPLLDEEALERQRAWQEATNNNMAAGGSPGMMGGADPMAQYAHLDPNNPNNNPNSGAYSLPAAILAQYPALAALSWDSLGQGNPVDDEDISGRSSFDASSGGEGFYDDEGGDGGYVSGPGTGYASAGMVGGWQ